MEPPPVSEELRALLKEIGEAVTGPSFPQAEWYWTQRDYRARVASDRYSRVFFVLRVAKDHFRGGVETRNGKDVWFEIGSLLDFKNHREEIQTAYKEKLRFL